MQRKVAEVLRSQHCKALVVFGSLSYHQAIRRILGNTSSRVLVENPLLGTEKG